MNDYVLAHGGEAERERLALLERFHGPLTVQQLEAAGVAPGWRCLEAGAGGGAMTAWLAERVGPSGSVLAVDLKTVWLEPLRSDIVDVRQLDIAVDELPREAFDLVLARMLLLHLRDPAAACRRLVSAARPGGQIVLHDADFSPVSLADATETETEGLAAHNATMSEAGVDLACGTKLADMLTGAGATISSVETSETRRRGGSLVAQITAITLDWFRGRAIAAGTPEQALDAAIAALNDPDRQFIGPTQWVVRALAPT